MNAPSKLAAYSAALTVVFAASMVFGSAIGPVGLANAKPTEAHAMPKGMTLPGLAAADAGLRLAPATDTVRLGIEAPYRFRIIDKNGPVTDFNVEHTRRMHFIVVRRDFVGFQHLHPTMHVDGTWEIPLELRDAGTYRVFADFVVSGTKHTLGTDLFVPGDQHPQPLPKQNDRADAGDGYTVELNGEPDAGTESELTFVVRRDGKVVNDLSEYLGARGHLVALRDGDLAYLHIHADTERLSFAADLPTTGAYRLFLQFRHAGRVRTAAFTINAKESR